MSSVSRPKPSESGDERLRDRIAGHPFFKGLHANLVRTLAIYAMETSYGANEHIFRQGDVANRFYLVIEGRTVLEMAKPGSAPAEVQIIGPGDVLGWSWLFPPYYWHFDARTLEPVNAIFFYATRLREHCEEDPRLGYELMQRVAEVVVRRLDSLQQTLLNVKRPN